jgi:hypothetical protein
MLESPHKGTLANPEMTPSFAYHLQYETKSKKKGMLVATSIP